MNKNFIVSFILAVILGLAATSAVAQDDSYCKSLPLQVREALRNLPTGQEIPCDRQHLVVISDLHKVIVAAAGDAYKTNPKFKQVEQNLSGDLGFTFGTRFPIYLNLPSDRLAALEAHNDPTAEFRVACLLVHERAHANGEGRESVAHQAELDCLRNFQSRGSLPASFSLRPLEQLIADYKRQEQHLQQVASK